MDIHYRCLCVPLKFRREMFTTFKTHAQVYLD